MRHGSATSLEKACYKMNTPILESYSETGAKELLECPCEHASALQLSQ